MIKITKQQAKEMTGTLRGMVIALREWTPKNKEGILTLEELHALQDDAQSVINTLNDIEG